MADTTPECWATGVIYKVWPDYVRWAWHGSLVEAHEAAQRLSAGYARAIVMQLGPIRMVPAEEK